MLYSGPVCYETDNLQCISTSISMYICMYSPSPTEIRDEDANARMWLSPRGCVPVIEGEVLGSGFWVLAWMRSIHVASSLAIT